MPGEALIQEMEMLDLALRDEWVSSGFSSEWLARLHQGVRIATSAAIRGYARPELEAIADWDPSLIRLRSRWF